MDKLLNGLTKAYFHTRELGADESAPYGLLLLADETRKAIDRYLHKSQIYVMGEPGSINAVYVLCPFDETRMEIKNLAVATSFQNKGIGRFLLEDASVKAQKMGYQEIIAGAPEVSEKLIGFYEKAGFEKYDRRNNFYIENYTYPIFENGKQLVNMQLLKKAILP